MMEDVNSGTCNETMRWHKVAALAAAENKVSKISSHEYVFHHPILF